MPNLCNLMQMIIMWRWWFEDVKMYQTHIIVMLELIYPAFGFKGECNHESIFWKTNNHPSFSKDHLVLHGFFYLYLFLNNLLLLRASHSLLHFLGLFVCLFESGPSHFSDREIFGRRNDPVSHFIFLRNEPHEWTNERKKNEPYEWD